MYSYSISSFIQVLGLIAYLSISSSNAGKYYADLNAFESEDDKSLSFKRSPCIKTGFFRNEMNCKKFYRCVDHAGILYRYDFDCAPDHSRRPTAFDENPGIWTCNWQTFETCIRETMTTPFRPPPPPPIETTFEPPPPPPIETTFEPPSPPTQTPPPIETTSSEESEDSGEDHECSGDQEGCHDDDDPIDAPKVVDQFPEYGRLDYENIQHP